MATWHMGAGWCLLLGHRMCVAVFVGIPALLVCCCRTLTLLKPQGGAWSCFWRPGQLAGCRAARRRHRREGRGQSRLLDRS